MENSSINCPHCGGHINVNEILYSQMHNQLSQDFNVKLNLERKEIENKNNELEKEKSDLLKLKMEIDNAIDIGITKKLIVEKGKLEKEIREQITDEKSEEVKSYKEQLDEKSQELKTLNRLKAENEKLQREKLELKDKIEAEAEIKITCQVEEQRQKIRKDAEVKNELKLAEREHIIQQLKDQLTLAQQKAEQGSGQLRGEVMETGLESYLRENFPFDIIEEIKKGAKGADCLHVVRTPMEECCGSIYYESKRTKEFQISWIQKFKEDMRSRNASVGVIVTETYPKGYERLLLKEGIWICSYQEAKGLCFVLRESLILLNNARTSQVDKSGKMGILYDYVISNEFRMQIEAIVDGFSEMQNALSSERRAMEAIWKRREKQIQQVLVNTTHIYSSVRAIAGNAVQEVKMLELPINE